MAEYTERPEPLHTVEEPDLSGTYTAEDYMNWTFEGLYELIRGKVFKMSPAPASRHQRLVGWLHAEMIAYFDENPCQLWIAPFDVYLVHPGEDPKKTRNVLEPDLCVICDSEKIKTFGCVGSPDFVIEVLSPSNSSKDVRLKREVYEEYGVAEYWMVHVSDQLITVNRLDENGKYVTTGPFALGDVISPRQFPGLEISLDEMFASIKNIP